MSKSLEKLWLITMLSPSPGIVRSLEQNTITALTCDEHNGALVFRGGNNLSIKAIIAAGQWQMVEKEIDDNSS